MQGQHVGCGVLEHRTFRNNTNPKPSTERGKRRNQNKGGTAPNPNKK